MKKGVFAICDSESDYLYRLMEYLDPQISHRFKIHAFSTVDSLIKYDADNRIELLLLSNDLIEKGIDQLNCKSIILLSEGEKKLDFQEYATVYKYQSAQEILRQAMYIYAKNEKEQKEQNYIPFKKEINLVAFYSPWNDDLQTSLAMEFGFLEGKERNTLYLNLKGYHGFDQFVLSSSDSLHQDLCKRDLSDLIYFLKNKRNKFADYIFSIIATMKVLDYISPMENPMDIKEVTLAEWLMLFDEIINQTKYETIILDLTDEIEGSLELLERCGKIIIPKRKEKNSEGKMQQLDKMLIAQGKVKIKDKMMKIVISQETLENAAAKIHKIIKEEEENQLSPNFKK